MRTRMAIILAASMLLIACPGDDEPGDGPALARSNGVTYYVGCGPEIPESALGKVVALERDFYSSSEYEARAVKGFAPSDVIALREVGAVGCDGVWNPAIARTPDDTFNRPLSAKLERRFGAPAPPGSDVKAPTGLIVYVRRVSENAPDDTDLFAVDPETGARWNLTKSRGSELDVVPSPNGKRVLFRRKWAEARSQGATPKQSGIFVMNLTTRQSRRVIPCLSSGCVEALFAWSPDGTRIAYVGMDSIHTMRANGSNNVTVCAGEDCGPAPGELIWAPSGGALAWSGSGLDRRASRTERITWAEHPQRFGLGAAADSSISIVDLAKGVIRTISRDCGKRCGDASPIWSADSDQIAFVRHQFDEDEYPLTASVIMTSAADGALRVSSPCAAKCRFPWPRQGHDVVSIDGEVLAIHSTGRHDHRNLYLSGEPSVAAQSVTWSPDNGFLAVLGSKPSRDDGPYALYMIRQDGKLMRKLDEGPTWETCCGVAWVGLTPESLGLEEPEGVTAPYETQS